MKRRSDPQGPYIRVYLDLIRTPAYRVLSYSAKALFFDLRAQFNGMNNGNLSATLQTLKHSGWSSPATLSKALYQLRVMGFLAITRMGGLKQGTRVCSLYRFTDLPVFDIPKLNIQAMKATHEYRRFDTVKVARLELDEGVRLLQEQGAKKQQPRKKPLVQNRKPTDTGSVLEEPFSSTDSVQSAPSPVQILNTEVSQ